MFVPSVECIHIQVFRKGRRSRFFYTKIMQLKYYNYEEKKNAAEDFN